MGPVLFQQIHLSIHHMEDLCSKVVPPKRTGSDLYFFCSSSDTAIRRKTCRLVACVASLIRRDSKYLQLFGQSVTLWVKALQRQWNSCPASLEQGYCNPSLDSKSASSLSIVARVVPAPPDDSSRPVSSSAARRYMMLSNRPLICST